MVGQTGVTYMDYGKINDTNNYNGDSKKAGGGSRGGGGGVSGSKKTTQETRAQNSSN